MTEVQVAITAILAFVIAAVFIVVPTVLLIRTSKKTEQRINRKEHSLSTKVFPGTGHKVENIKKAKPFVFILCLIAIIGIIAYNTNTSKNPKENNQKDQKEEQYAPGTPVIDFTETSQSFIESPTVGSPETKLSQNPEYQRTVYYTRTGECYHDENPCGRGNYYATTLGEALQMGLRPCEKCVLH